MMLLPAMLSSTSSCVVSIIPSHQITGTVPIFFFARVEKNVAVQGWKLHSRFATDLTYMIGTTTGSS
jgi:hypothetical protein